MKLSLALSLATGIHASKAERDVHKLYENIETCGTIQLDKNSTEVHDQLVLDSEQDACLFRVQLGKKRNFEVKEFKIDLECDDGEIFIFTGDKNDRVIGPFCNEHKYRRRRNANGYAMEDLHGHMLQTNELDMVVQKAKPFSAYYGNQMEQDSMIRNYEKGDNYQFSSYSNNANLAGLGKGIQFNTHKGGSFGGGGGHHRPQHRPQYQPRPQYQSFQQYRPLPNQYQPIPQQYQAHQGHSYGDHRLSPPQPKEKSNNNGQLRFGFDLVLDLPGAQGDDNHHHHHQAPPVQNNYNSWASQLYQGGCSYKHIKAANAPFYQTHHNNGIANTLFNRLTDSMYDFQCFYDRYRDQCQGPIPVTVACHLANFQNSHKSTIDAVEAIIDTQCQLCRGGAGSICTEWYILFAQVKYALEQPANDEAALAAAAAMNAAQNYQQVNGQSNDPSNDPPVTQPQVGQNFNQPNNDGEGSVNLGQNFNQPTNDQGSINLGQNFNQPDNDGVASINPGQNFNQLPTNNQGAVNLGQNFNQPATGGQINLGSSLCGPDECAAGAHNCDASAVCINTCKSFECECQDGFFGNGQECCDYNQCMVNNGGCGANSKCVDKCKGRSCECLPGYEMVDGECTSPSENCDANQCLYNNGDCGSYGNCVDKCDGHVCACVEGAVLKDGICQPACDENQCDSDPCGANSICVNECDGYSCKCEEGFNLVQGLCMADDGCDGNQCATGEATCGVRSTCVDQCEGYTCECVAGFSWDGENCCDVDQCETGQNFCPANSHCINRCYGYTCECNDGYSMASGDCIRNSNAPQCEEDTCGEHGTCTDLDDGFECTCEENYGVDAVGICSLVLDQNQCETGESDCGPNQECSNLDLGFECNCVAGFHMEGNDCVKDADANQCSNGEADCGPNATCLELSVGFECYCNEGFHLEANSCVRNRDANQCETGEAICGDNQVCLDQPVGYECACTEGYMFEGSVCVPKPDGNQCVTGEADCGPYSICTDQNPGYSCSCIDGYHMEGEVCVVDRDANQCATGEAQCGANGFCHDLASGFECLCILGYHREGDACLIDRDADQCETGEAVCAENQNCVDKVIGYECVCKDDFHVENGVCVANGDGDQCASGEANCGPNAECVDELVGFTCHCIAGFHMSDNNVCVANRDANQCSNGEANCGANADCYDLKEGFECRCMADFFGDGYTCCDANQCVETNSCPENSHCINECLGYKCECNSGFVMKYGQCIPDCDANQCATGEGMCGVNAVCVDQCEGFTCECRAGFVGDGETCCDVNQCDLGAQCQENAVCVNECHGYRCECAAGFVLNYGMCQPEQDQNQCATGEAICDVNADCIDMAVGFECRCRDGFTGDGNTCCDADQCTMGAQCGANEHCVNTCIGYKCECNAGYERKHGTCRETRDDNQCATGEAKCGVNAVCVDLPVGYECVCDDGFTGDGQTCCDADQCSSGVECPVNSVCVNECLGYSCECVAGFEFKHGECQEIRDENQCANGEARCAPNAQCVDLAVGYECECPAGFTGNGFDSCCDEDQCASGAAECPTNAACVNECTGYTCECNEGFVEKNGGCVPTCDADECAAGNNDCSEFATCTDLCRGYECTCKDGYYGDGYTCCDGNQCNTVNCSANSHCVNLCSGYVCECDHGYSKNSDDICMPDCDVNQCEEGNHNCDEHALCVDECAGFKCVCQENWYGDGLNCCDENQCNDNNGGCDETQNCVDQCQGYKCECASGYKLENGVCVEICDEVNECEDGSHKCSEYAKCNNKCHGYECVCVQGFTYGEGDECCDRKQCEEDPCGTNTRCIEQCDGFQCVCEDDYVPVDSYVEGEGLLNCRHSDKCYNIQCPSNSVCNIGVCYCMDGYYANGDGICVEMVDECSTGEHNCHSSATCTDTVTSFTCTCPPGLADVNEDGTNCIHAYYLNYGMCYLTDYALFTNSRFEALARDWTYCVPDAINAWRMITDELTRLGEQAFNLRSHQCNVMAGYIGCGYISPLWLTVDDSSIMGSRFQEGSPACEWAHELETLITQVGKQCQDGWKLKFQSTFDTLRRCACDEPDDCNDGNHNCDVNAVCTSNAAQYGQSYSGYSCECNDGYYGNGITCVEEINECATGVHRCDANASCTDFSAGYECTCDAGFAGNGYKCKELINECAMDQHDCHRYAICTDLENGYMCECDDANGYTGDGRFCEGPQDECLIGTHRCHPEHGICANTYDSYTCSCAEGYAGDGYNCYKPLVCPWTSGMDYSSYGGDYGTASPGMCSLKYTRVCWGSIFPVPASGGFAHGGAGGGVAATTSAFFSSSSMSFCNAHAASVQFTAFLTELYTLGLIYDQTYHPAQAHTSVVPDDRFGSMCPPDVGALPCELINFHNIATIEQFTARIDQIITHIFARCSPSTVAQWGAWMASFRSLVVCPVNECLTGAHQCSANAQCIDKEVGYECMCRPHYEGDGVTCQIRDYCANPTTCSQYADCVPGFGGLGYSCPCKAGYAGPDCRPVDPCLSNNGGCHAMAICQSEIIGWNVNHWCKCKIGWYGNGKICEAIDACGSHNCDPDNGVCVPHAIVQSHNDYDCKCRAGFVGNGYQCREYVDPCQSVNCGTGATCVKETDSFGLEAASCQCVQGYRGDGFFCTRVDPCETANCHHLATCTSSGPYFSCACPDGMLGDGVTYCALPNPCEGQNPCHPDAQCNPLTNGQYTCSCKPGFEGDGQSCVLKTTQPAPVTLPSNPNGGSIVYNNAFGSSGCFDQCDPNGTCVKANGYSGQQVYYCVCLAPYKGDGFVCERDTSECKRECPSITECQDGICKCLGELTIGYWYSFKQGKCIDRNECSKSTNNNCHSQATCVNTVGGFTCKCKQGYVGDGVTCITEAQASSGELSSLVVMSLVSAQHAHQNDGAAIQISDLKGKWFFTPNGGWDGTKLSQYAQFSDGECSLAGYDFGTARLRAQMNAQDAVFTQGTKVDAVNAYKGLVAEFANLGQSVLTRNGPACSAAAGKVDCRLLHFPWSEHRCQLARRMEKVYRAVAPNCNAAWNSKFGSMMDTLLYTNAHYNQGKPCPRVNFLL